MTLATDILLALSLVALLEVAYRLGRRDKQAEQRVQGFLEGWNAAIDAAGRAMHAPTPKGHAAFEVRESHREAQLRAAQGGWQ
jgi:hypothetical protein